MIDVVAVADVDSDGYGGALDGSGVEIVTSLGVGAVGVAVCWGVL